VLLILKILGIAGIFRFDQENDWPGLSGSWSKQNQCNYENSPIEISRPRICSLVIQFMADRVGKTLEDRVLRRTVQLDLLDFQSTGNCIVWDSRLWNHST
jgi:hypothetical protein